MTGKRLPEAGDDGAGGRSSNPVVTMAEVAERAGVSTATVSRVLCGRSSVAPEFRAKVSAAVEELSYRPNRPARNAGTVRTHSRIFRVNQAGRGKSETPRRSGEHVKGAVRCCLPVFG